MPNSRMQDRVLETYARSLMEAAKAEDRVFRDFNELEIIANAAPEVIAVVASLFERGQLDLLPQIVATFKEMTEEDEDVVGVTVTTAVPLDDELRRTVFLIEKVDPSIIGGLVLEARGQRRDISVKTQLRAAREALVSTSITNGGEA